MDSKLDLAMADEVGEYAADEVSTSAVSWPAILAGAAVAVAASLLLAAIGSGLGLASISPWPGEGVSAGTFTAVAVIWLIIVQWIASGLGGYVTGRLRTKWAGTHTHEVFFRDTAHGFVTWSVATLVAFAVSAAAGSAVLDAGASRLASASTASATPTITAPTISAYDVDTLFRVASPGANVAAGAASGSSASNEARAEATRILTVGLTHEGFPAADRTYLIQLLSAGGVSPTDAQMRIDDMITKLQAANVTARAAADNARRTAATTSLFVGLSMLIGAFIACTSAALGGQLRDRHP